MRGRQCLRKPYSHRKKTLNTVTWEISGLPFTLFLRRGILLPAGECTKCFSPATSQGNHKILSYLKRSKTTGKGDNTSSFLPPSLVSFFPPFLPSSHPASPFLHITDAVRELLSFLKHPKKLSGCCISCLLPYDLQITKYS